MREATPACMSHSSMISAQLEHGSGHGTPRQVSTVAKMAEYRSTSMVMHSFKKQN
eukprot:m.116480 g.116480  ORF g.116480 m.116480 type:complete len:55 (-) comp15519_c0_seq1:265-429(-)